jgi:transposase
MRNPSPNQKHKHLWLPNPKGTSKVCQRCGVIRSGGKIFKRHFPRARKRRLRT